LGILVFFVATIRKNTEKETEYFWTSILETTVLHSTVQSQRDRALEAQENDSKLHFWFSSVLRVNQAFYIRPSRQVFLLYETSFVIGHMIGGMHKSVIGLG